MQLGDETVLWLVTAEILNLICFAFKPRKYHLDALLH